VKKLFRWVFRLLILWVFTAVVVFFLCLYLLPPYAEPKIKTFLEDKISQIVRGRLQIGEVKILNPYPFIIEFRKLTLTSTVMPIQSNIKTLHLRVSIAGFNFPQKAIKLHTQVDLLEPQVDFNLKFFKNSYELSKKMQLEPPSSAPVPPVAISSLVDVNVQQAQVSIQDPDVGELKSLKISNWNLNVIGVGSSTPFWLDTQMKVEMVPSLIPLALPISLKGNFTDANSIFSSSGVELDMAGLSVKGQGQSRLEPAWHNWNFAVEIPKLEALPVPPQFLPPGKWSGGLSGKVHFYSVQGSASPKVDADIQMKSLQGIVDFKQNNLYLKGQVQASALAKIEYFNGLKAPQLELGLNLNQAQVEYKPFLTKPAATPLNFNFAGYYSDSRLVLKTFFFQLAQVQATAQGFLSQDPKKPSDFELSVPLVDLRGFEKLIPLASAYPVTGQIQMKAHIRGMVTQPDLLEVDVAPFDLKKISANIQYASADKKIEVAGPASIDASGKFSMKGKTLGSAYLSGNFDFSQMLIRYADLFYKKANSILKMNLRARQKGPEVLDVENFNLQAEAFKVEVQGQIKKPNRPELNLRVSLKPLLFEPLANLLPQLKTFQLKGQAQAQMVVSGVYDLQQGIQKSPLAMKGSTSVKIPNFVYTTVPPPVEKNPKVPPPVVANTSFLPNWPLFEKSQFEYRVDIDQLNFNQLPIQGMSAKGMLDRGQLRSTINVAKVFSAPVKMNLFVQDLTKLNPPSTLNIDFQGIEIEQAILWALPEFKDLAKGKAVGQIAAAFPFLPFPNPTALITAQGQMRINRGVFQFERYFKMAKDKLEKIPGIGSKITTPQGPLEAALSAEFEFKKQKMKFEKLNMITSQMDELKASGTLDLNKNVDMEGLLFLKNPPVKGSFLEANQDEQGRLRVPFAIEGNMTDPQMKYAEKTITEMTQRMLLHEKDKALNQLKSKAQDEIKKKTKEAGQQLQDQFKKKLKGLLGN
jgi:hypothetical protein